MQPDATLTPVQQEVLHRLACGESVLDAALGAGVHRNTVTNWRNTVPAFTRELERNTRERILQNQEKLANLVPHAIEVLSTILHNEKASPSVRLRAALSVMKMAAAVPQREPVEEPVPQTAPVTVPAPKPLSPEPPAPVRAAPVSENLHNSAQQLPFRRPGEPARNALCPCGSGIKYKRCCVNSLPLARQAA
jgi:uncharacterized protein YecA (UPF0149 family)